MENKDGDSDSVKSDTAPLLSVLRLEEVKLSTKFDVTLNGHFCFSYIVQGLK